MWLLGREGTPVSGLSELCIKDISGFIDIVGVRVHKLDKDGE